MIEKRCSPVSLLLAINVQCPVLESGNLRMRLPCSQLHVLGLNPSDKDIYIQSVAEHRSSQLLMIVVL